jgi:hypothetical protein
MKTHLIFLLSLSLLLLSACQRDGPKVDKDNSVLRHDDANLDAPELPGGTYEGAARFLASEMSTYSGRELIEVQYYLKVLPRYAEIRIYGQSDNDEPVTLLYQADISQEAEAESWNVHSLPNPLLLEAQDLWLAVRFAHDLPQRTLGCDPGPAVANGDWLLDEVDGEWLPLRQRSATDINWNIRGVVR